jgi:predicted metal-dependent hydrolase
MSEFRSGDLLFDLRFSARRRTVEISVKRDGSLVLDAPPEGADEQRLLAFIEAKRLWIYRKIAEREELGDVPNPKRYQDGEGFRYLGKTYRLRLADHQDEPLRFDKGRFILDRASLPKAQKEFELWYARQAQAWLSTYVRRYAARMETNPRAVVVRNLGFRWGSCGKGDRLYFHWKTALLQTPLIEYVVVHELAHLREPHHTPDFWLIVERAMPDFTERQKRLGAEGIEVEEAI